MSSMFDFNNDGHTDFGEQYVGYKIFEDCTKKDGGTFGPKRSGLSGFDIFILCLIGYAILNTICGWLY